ncbi:precorrin-6A reductase [Eubacteriales bacterium KG127]
MCKKIGIFSGTGEGRQLAKWATDKGIEDNLIFFVATEYGGEMMKDFDHLDVREGRLTPEEMSVLFAEENIKLVVDATHPYATKVTENIKAACGEDTPYLRLYRKSNVREIPGLVFVPSMEAAALMLDEFSEKVLLTTGSKEIGKYAQVKDKKTRLMARVLPTIESLNLCFDAGIEKKNIIAMQGPFTKEMNIATMNQYGCKILVTKDTGTMGGFQDKAALAELGYKIIIVKRPTEEIGFSVEEIKEKILNDIEA